MDRRGVTIILVYLLVVSSYSGVVVRGEECEVRNRLYFGPCLGLLCAGVCIVEGYLGGRCHNWWNDCYCISCHTNSTSPPPPPPPPPMPIPPPPPTPTPPTLAPAPAP